ncbi:MAG: hypothetical protein LBB59_00295 [Campylobacteraceae bacterium]|jgi:hypothetical protein|nr:hypothetical protein [Campylobacteraceae bacterium]
MQETVHFVQNTLVFCIAALDIAALCGLIFFAFTREKEALWSRFRAVMPLYYMFLAIIMLCILLLLSFGHFQFYMAHFVIFAVWIYAFSSAIFSYRLGKRRSEKFRIFTFYKYLGDAAILFLIYIFGMQGFFDAVFIS